MMVYKILFYAYLSKNIFFFISNSGRIQGKSKFGSSPLQYRYIVMKNVKVEMYLNFPMFRRNTRASKVELNRISGRIVFRYPLSGRYPNFSDIRLSTKAGYNDLRSKVEMGRISSLFISVIRTNIFQLSVIGRTFVQISGFCEYPAEC